MARSTPVRFILVALAACSIGLVPLPASASGGWKAVTTENPGASTNDNDLYAASAISGKNAWAVGYYSDGSADHTLAEHWNGTAWSQTPTPDPGGPEGSGHDDNYLYGVAGTSSTDAWAVGSYNNGIDYSTLIAHWDGLSWNQVPSVDPGGPSNGNRLLAVEATSTTSAWAVGDYYDGSATRSLTERWNGSAWSHVASPSPSSIETYLTGVAATSPKDVWAVGNYNNGTADQTLILHWNGKAWKRVKSPNPGGASMFNVLYGVAAVSPSDVWAVGSYGTASTDHTLILHWNGKAWKRVKSPNPGGASEPSELTGVTATSSTSAWAVGWYNNGSVERTMVMRWNGVAWKKTGSPNPGGSSSDHTLLGVSGSRKNAWAVGYYNTGSADQTLALHCC